MLKPLKKQKRPKNPKFFTADIETWDGLKGTQFRCGAIYNGTKDYVFSKIDAMMKYMLRTSRLVYVHNLSFDGRFFIDWVIDNKTKYTDMNLHIIYSHGILGIIIKHSPKNGKFKIIKIIDSLRLLPLSQAELEKMFLGKQIKHDIDWTKTVSDSDITKRVKSDVVGLWQLLMYFFRDDPSRIRSLELWDLHVTKFINHNFPYIIFGKTLIQRFHQLQQRWEFSLFRNGQPYQRGL